MIIKMFFIKVKVKRISLMEMMNKLKSEIVQKRQIFKQQRKNLKKEMLMIFKFKKNKISKIEGLFNKEKILLVFLFLRL